MWTQQQRNEIFIRGMIMCREKWKISSLQAHKLVVFLCMLLKVEMIAEAWSRLIWDSKSSSLMMICTLSFPMEVYNGVVYNVMYIAGPRGIGFSTKPDLWDGRFMALSFGRNVIFNIRNQKDVHLYRNIMLKKCIFVVDSFEPHNGLSEEPKTERNFNITYDLLK